MRKYVIERDIPGIGSLSHEELVGAAQKSNDAVLALVPRVQWQESFVTADKVYCVFVAEDEDVVREHAVLSGFPADRVSRVRTILDPTTSDR